MLRVMRRDAEMHLGSFSAVRLLTVPSMIAFSIGPVLVAEHAHLVWRMTGLFLWGLGVVGFIFAIRITEDIRDSEIVREQCRKAWRAGMLHQAKHPDFRDELFGHNPYEVHIDSAGVPTKTQVI